MMASLFFLLLLVPLVSYLRNFGLIQGHEDLRVCFILSFIVLTLTFRSLIHFQLIFVYAVIYSLVCLSWWLSGKESACNAGNEGLIPGLGRTPGEVNGNPLQYSWLGNPMERGAWQAAVHGVSKEWGMS